MRVALRIWWGTSAQKVSLRARIELWVASGLPIVKRECVVKRRVRRFTSGCRRGEAQPIIAHVIHQLRHVLALGPVP